MTRKRILCVIGTRPEAIKMAPVIASLRASEWADCVVVATAQHRDLLDQMLKRLQISVDHDLNLMTTSQTSSDLLGRMLPAIDCVLRDSAFDAVLAQGDTTTVFAAALAAFHRQVRFGHVEAGLRTYDLAHPFPEEGYRQAVARFATWHFAPTAIPAANLRNEGVASDKVYVTGNTGIDTLLSVAAQIPLAAQSGRRMILLTAHRRESFGARLKCVFQAVRDLIDRYHDIDIVYPVHPNPNVTELAQSMLGKTPRVSLSPSLDYFDFVALMKRAHLILTDSGGIQEEAPALSIPVLVLRETTERPEAIAAKVAELVGTDTARITGATAMLLDDPKHYREMAKGASPYGDGQASQRIREILRSELCS